MGLIIYFIYLALYWEAWFKMRPGVFSLHRFSILSGRALFLIFSTLIYGSNLTTSVDFLPVYMSSFGG